MALACDPKNDNLNSQTLHRSDLFLDARATNQEHVDRQEVNEDESLVLLQLLVASLKGKGQIIFSCKYRVISVNICQ